ncbi:MAG TPA: hypothetical protein VM914_05330 [Pyrinomonadaceae bacterium]|jgi:hypothetical protein|nr:hypothetical protein [Pyrinomonadaceae bacterium]
MSNNPQASDVSAAPAVSAAADVNIASIVDAAASVLNVVADIVKEFPHEKVFTVEEVAHKLEMEHAGASPNGNGLVPAPPAGAGTRLLSGRYVGPNDKVGTPGELHLELRVDVDGKRAIGNVSGDLFKMGIPSDENAVSLVYLDSFVLAKGRRMTVSADKVEVSGKAEYAVRSKDTIIAVEVPRSGADTTATVTFTREDDGFREETFKCAFASEHFRMVQYEVDVMEGTEVFGPYDTKLLKSGGPPRELSLGSAYGEAGIKMIEVKDAGAPNVVSTELAKSLAGPDAKWKDSEIHDAMLTQFSLLDLKAQTNLSRERQWKFWLFVASEHEQGLRGVMFDSENNRARQGCAVFYNALIAKDRDGNQPSEDEILRGALRTYVHEVGHCLNLAHSFEKPDAESLPHGGRDALSYMNYVDEYPEGVKAYWEKFAFEFDEGELRHLRHAFRDNVIMGGGKFGFNAAEPGAHGVGPRQRQEQESGLELKLTSPRETFMISEPVVVELKLHDKCGQGKRVHASIHPDRGFVRLAIRRPDGSVVPYRPFSTRCAESDFTALDREQPSIYASAYIGYGRDGLYFERAGRYEIVALYRSPCGAQVVSEPHVVNVRNPSDKTEDEIADLYYGDEQGKLFYLLGSDSEHLKSGRRSLENVIDKYCRHPLSVHAHFVKGLNDGSYFKAVTAEKKVFPREPLKKESLELLARVFRASAKGADLFGEASGQSASGTPGAGGPAEAPPLDNITLNMCARRIARTQKRMGDEKAAEATLKAIYCYFERQKLKPHVLKRIKAQGDRTREEKY